MLLGPSLRRILRALRVLKHITDSGLQINTKSYQFSGFASI
jgi:hypothetical protein